MKIHELFEKLEKSKVYHEFKETEEGKESFFCAGFFILRIKNKENELALDFRNEKEIFTFKIPEQNSEIAIQREPILPAQKPLDKIAENLKLRTDLDNLRGFVEILLQNNKISNELEEIVAVLQKRENVLAWHLTCMLKGFVIVTIQIDAEKGKSISFEKKSLFDFVSAKKVSK